MPKYNPIPENGPRLVVSNKFPELHNQLLDAIHTRRQISFTYLDKPRIVEPHDYGIQNGSARLLSYQIGGESSSGRLPNWRIFDVDKMSDFKMLEKTFPGNRPAKKHYQWDKLFIRVAEPE
jgi:predicted DNA-binding transcriptional regulator YafY